MQWLRLHLRPRRHIHTDSTLNCHLRSEPTHPRRSSDLRQRVFSYAGRRRNRALLPWLSARPPTWQTFSRRYVCLRRDDLLRAGSETAQSQRSSFREIPFKCPTTGTP
jgi:hypothetical protein